MSKRCIHYAGYYCVNGQCPIAEYNYLIDEGMFDLAESLAGINCKNCFYYQGCADCAFWGTLYCDDYHDYQEGLKQDGNDKL